MPPLEAWEKVLVDFDAYSETQHALLTCIECHRGVDDSDKETAHEGLRHDPSLEVDVACARCHPDESAQQEGNLHSICAATKQALPHGVPRRHMLR